MFLTDSFISTVFDTSQMHDTKYIVNPVNTFTSKHVKYSNFIDACSVNAFSLVELNRVYLMNIKNLQSGIII